MVRSPEMRLHASSDTSLVVPIGFSAANCCSAVERYTNLWPELPLVWCVSTFVIACRSLREGMWTNAGRWLVASCDRVAWTLSCGA